MGRNANETRPAKLLVLVWLLANKGGKYHDVPIHIVLANLRAHAATGPHLLSEKPPCPAQPRPILQPFLTQQASRCGAMRKPGD